MYRIKLPLHLLAALATGVMAAVSPASAQTIDTDRPAFVQPTVTCMRVQPGCHVQVINAFQVNLRQSPGYVGKSAFDIVAQVPYGSTLLVLPSARFADTPAYADDLVWWRVRFASLEGWIAEFTNTRTPLLRPVVQFGGAAPCWNGRAYIVAPGEYLVTLSNRFGPTVTGIMRANRLASIDLVVGQPMCIPPVDLGPPLDNVVGEVGAIQLAATVPVTLAGGTIFLRRAERGVARVHWSAGTVFEYAIGSAASPAALAPGQQIEVLAGPAYQGDVWATRVYVLDPAGPWAAIR